MSDPIARGASFSLQNLLIQVAGAVAWGIYLSVVPFPEGVYVGSIIWLPIFIWRERVRARKYGFWIGFLARIAVIALVVTAAVYLPVKQQDRIRVGPLERNQARLTELAEAIRMWQPVPEDKFNAVVTLPSANPTYREVIRSIETQTGLKLRVSLCGTGASILSGGYPIGVSVE